MTTSKVTFRLVKLERTVGEGDDAVQESEEVIHEETREVVGDLPKAIDIMDEPKFYKARKDAKLAPSEVQVRHFAVPFVQTK